MDPKATLEECLAAIRAADYDRAHELLDAYGRWRAVAGGFAPRLDGVSGDLIAAECEERLDAVGDGPSRPDVRMPRPTAAIDPTPSPTAGKGKPR